MIPERIWPLFQLVCLMFLALIISPVQLLKCVSNSSANSRSSSSRVCSSKLDSTSLGWSNYLIWKRARSPFARARSPTTLLGGAACSHIVGQSTSRLKCLSLSSPLTYCSVGSETLLSSADSSVLVLVLATFGDWSNLQNLGLCRRQAPYILLHLFMAVSGLCLKNFKSLFQAELAVIN